MKTKPRLYWGPIWGKFPVSMRDPVLNKKYDHCLYGGYNFFSSNKRDVVPLLLEYQSEFPAVHFGRSRFEDYFLVLANLMPEQSYSFKRWINPFSGILSAIDVLGLSWREYLRQPDEFGFKLNKRLIELNQLDFYRELQVAKNGAVAIRLIENTIYNGEAFRNLCAYNEEGKVVVEEPYGPNLIQEYVDQTLGRMDEFSKHEFN